ncbi:hypothetical protein QR680_010876 [Steinernema hermaphroditum]|uniref:Uncharacterized protein n=1 Tax=Steinernema hermaphroditum TaxID=289476 RepID=A0AA39MCA0_9BILA|nr:hypothetical protein QR680_010876 [Steinernema hermaphroditum]
MDMASIVIFIVMCILIVITIIKTISAYYRAMREDEYLNGPRARTIVTEKAEDMLFPEDNVADGVMAVALAIAFTLLVVVVLLKIICEGGCRRKKVAPIPPVEVTVV